MAESVYLGSVWASFDLRAEGFNSGINQIQNSMGNLKTTVLGVFGGNLLTNAFQTATRAAVGFADDSLHAAADLETGLNLLQQITQGTTAQMELLRRKSVELGNDLTLPNVSAADAADAMIQLGKAGLSVNDILGASKGVLQAATAGNISVGDAATYVSSALLAFNLAGTEATQVADLLAAAANATSADIPDIALALQQVSAQAHQLGIPLKETVALIGEMANVGIRGSDAGTSLKTALQRLIPFSQEAADTYKQLGIDVFDANGNFIGMRATIAALQKGTANLTQEQKQNALQTIFGQDAYRAAAVVINGGVEQFDKMTAAVGRVGAAQDLAAARTKGFNGVVGALKSQIETFQISVGNVIKAALEPLLKLISNNLPSAIGVVVALLTGLATTAFLAAGGVGLLTAALGFLLSPAVLIGAAVAGIIATLVILYNKSQPVKEIMQEVGKAIVTAFKTSVDAVKQFWDTIKPVRDFIGNTLKQAFDSLGSILQQTWQALQPVIDLFQQILANKGVQQVLKVIGIALLALAAAPVVLFFASLIAILKVLQVVLSFIADHFTLVKNIVLVVLGVALSPLLIAIGLVVGAFFLLKAAIEFVVNAFQVVAGVVVAVVTTVFNTVVTVFTAIWNFLSPILDFIKNLFIIVFGVIAIVVLTYLQAVKDTIMTIWNFIYPFIVGVLSGIRDFIVSAWQTIYNLVSGVLSALRDFISAIWDTIYGIIKNVVTNIINFFAPAATWLYDRGRDIVTGLANGISAAASAVWNAIKTVSDQIGKFFSGAGSWLYDVGRAIIQGMVNGIYSMTGAVGDAAASVANTVKNKVKGLLGINSPSKVFMGYGVNSVEGFINGIVKMQSSLASSVSGVFDTMNPLQSGLGATVAAAPSGGRVTDSSGVSGGISTVINGNITIGSEVDADRFLARLTRNNQLAQKGLTTQ